MRDNDKHLVDLLDSIIDDELRTWLKSASQSEKRDEIVRLLRATFQKDRRSIGIIYLVARELPRKGKLRKALWSSRNFCSWTRIRFPLLNWG